MNIKPKACSEIMVRLLQTAVLWSNLKMRKPLLENLTAQFGLSKLRSTLVDGAKALLEKKMLEKMAASELLNPLNRQRRKQKKMLGRTLVTHQTGPAGKQVNRVYIEQGAEIESELYLALLVDRVTSRISFVCSTEGGMDIEDVAASNPEKILSFSVDPATGYQAFHGRKIAFALGLENSQVKECVKLMGQLFQAFIEKDMEMLEINPLIVTKKR